MCIRDRLKAVQQRAALQQRVDLHELRAISGRQQRGRSRSLRARVRRSRARAALQRGVALHAWRVRKCARRDAISADVGLFARKLPLPTSTSRWTLSLIHI